MPKHILTTPIWKYLVAALALLLLIVLALDLIIFLLLRIFTDGIAFLTIFLWSLPFYFISFYFLYRFLDARFLNVTPSASLFYPFESGPWLHYAGPPETSIVINWATKEEEESVVLLGENKKNLNEYRGKQGKIHHLLISGLKPDTEYYYRILNFKTEEMLYSFRTASENPTSVSIVLIGDTQNGGALGFDDWAFPQIIKGLKEENFDLLMHLGDATDQGNDIRSWHAFLDTASQVAQSKPLHVAVGNHDTGTNYLHDPNIKKYPDEGANFDYLLGYQYKTASEESQITPFRGRYYSFDYGHCHFLFVDTQNSKWAIPENPQWDFIKKDLENCASGQWKIVLLHRVMIEVKLDGDKPRYKYNRFAQFLLPLFDKYQVDVVFQGHGHYYQHINWTYSPECPFYDSDHQWDHSTIPYIVTGGAGIHLRRNALFTGEDTSLPGFVARENSSHYTIMKIKKEQAVIEPKYPNGTVLGEQRVLLRK